MESSSPMRNICEKCLKIWPWASQCVHGDVVSSEPIHMELAERKSELSLVETTKHELEVRQTEAIEVLGAGIQQIANFLVGGGLAEMLSGYARSQSVKDILGGLASHGGRAALDARFIKQNALEITEAVEAVFRKYQERLEEKGRDTEIKEPKE